MAPIWFAANHGDLGGGEVMTMNLARTVRDLGYDARIVAPATPARLVDVARAEGFATVAIHGRSPSRVAMNLAAWDLVERRGLLWANGLRAGLATAGHRDRILHLHQVPRGRQSWAVRVAAVGARATLVPSAFAAAHVRGATVLANWIQPFASPRPALNLSVPGRPVTLGFLGRLSVHKGLDVLAGALSLLEQREPGRFRLVLAGEPTYTDDADRAAIKAALHPVDHLVEHRGRQAPADFFASVDLAVFPSVIAESFGLVVAEAMSVGCPYVISDAGALPEVAGNHPYIARAGDVRSLADTVAAAVASYEPNDTVAAYERWDSVFSPSAGQVRMERFLLDLGVTS